MNKYFFDMIYEHKKCCEYDREILSDKDRYNYDFNKKPICEHKKCREYDLKVISPDYWGYDNNPLCKNGCEKIFSFYEYGFHSDCGVNIMVKFGGKLNKSELYTSYMCIDTTKHNYIDKIDELQHFYVIKNDNIIAEGAIYTPNNSVIVNFNLKIKIKDKYLRYRGQNKEENSSHFWGEYQYDNKKNFIESLEKENIKFIDKPEEMKFYKKLNEEKRINYELKYDEIKKKMSDFSKKMRDLNNELKLLKISMDECINDDECIDEDTGSNCDCDDNINYFLTA